MVAPGLTPKRGKGGSLASRQALLHSLCHIENWAVDLRQDGGRGGCGSGCSIPLVFKSGGDPHPLHHSYSWDVIARFGGQPDYELPREFFDDFVTVGMSRGRGPYLSMLMSLAPLSTSRPPLQ